METKPAVIGRNTNNLSGQVGHLISDELKQFPKQNTQGISRWNVFVNTNATQTQTASQYYEISSQPF